MAMGNVDKAIAELKAVVSGIETDGWKDAEKMARFVAACRSWEETI